MIDNDYFIKNLLKFEDVINEMGFKSNVVGQSRFTYLKDDYELEITWGKDHIGDPPRYYVSLIYKPCPDLLDLFSFTDSLFNNDQPVDLNKDGKCAFGIPDPEGLGFHLAVINRYKDVILKMPMPDPFWKNYKQAFRNNRTLPASFMADNKEYIDEEDCPFDENLNVKEKYNLNFK